MNARPDARAANSYRVRLEYTRPGDPLGGWRATIAAAIGWLPFVDLIFEAIGDRKVSLRIRDKSGIVVHQISFSDRYGEAKEAIERARGRLNAMTDREFESFYGFIPHG